MYIDLFNVYLYLYVLYIYIYIYISLYVSLYTYTYTYVCIFLGVSVIARISCGVSSMSNVLLNDDSLAPVQPRR